MACHKMHVDTVTQMSPQWLDVRSWLQGDNDVTMQCATAPMLAVCMSLCLSDNHVTFEPNHPQGMMHVSACVGANQRKLKRKDSATGKSKGYVSQLTLHGCMPKSHAHSTIMCKL